jgi:hypothetical protein
MVFLLLALLIFFLDVRCGDSMLLLASKMVFQCFWHGA